MYRIRNKIQAYFLRIIFLYKFVNGINQFIRSLNFFIFLSFLKIPYLKIRENFVLSCRHPFFGIYYIINQIFKHRTIFVQKRTTRTKTHKNAFCTKSKDFVLKGTLFRTPLTI